MVQKFKIKVSGRHPITDEPFSWFVHRLTQVTETSIKYRLLPDQSEDTYSCSEAAEIKKWAEDIKYKVELIPIRVN